ncbi:MAG: CBS domain-containing protein [Desulfobacteraceae bacterium]|nr:CBS domain-containing protein [Desulfobacteraceae bacterium]
MPPESKQKPAFAFSALSKSEEQELYNAFSYEKYAKDTTLFVQEISLVEKLFILSKGSVAYYFEKDNTKQLKGRLGSGDTFGGLSILFNDQMAIHTLATLEETVFLTIDAHAFSDLCKRNKGFQKYFTNEFGRCMLNRTFADIVARQVLDNSLNLPFFNQPISAIFRPNIITCPNSTSIHVAATKMSKNNTSAILVKSDIKRIQGIVTDADLRKKVLAKNISPLTPVSKIMSKPVISISSDSQVFEAFLTMIKKDKRHLAVYGKSGEISGILTKKDLIAAQTRSTFLLIKSIKAAREMADLENIHSKLERMLLDPIRNGASSEYITRLITTFSDAIIEKIIAFCLAEAGRPPCKFVFLTMGSEGREEQTLISDQDNAIVFEDLDNPKEAKKAKIYFDHLAQLICSRLDMAGYQFCDGDNMAQNPKWCQPLSIWKKNFTKWIRTGNPEDLLYSSIFFDFRGTWGEMELSNNLKSYLLKSIEGWSGFLRHLTENALYFKPPMGRFGKFLVHTQGEHKDAFDIKQAMLPLIDFTRVYALKNQIFQTNTLTRLFRLYTKHALSNKEYHDIVQSYNYLMDLRFRRQITTIMDEEKKPDNYINPKNLSYLDRQMLREIFKMTEKLQQKLNYDFTGIA